MKIFEHNTGRLYNDDGQLIRFCQIDRERIAFVDLARSIEGVVVHAGMGAYDDDEGAIRRRMLTAYDNMIYRMPEFDDEERAAISALVKGEPAHV